MFVFNIIYPIFTHNCLGVVSVYCCNMCAEEIWYVQYFSCWCILMQYWLLLLYICMFCMYIYCIVVFILLCHFWQYLCLSYVLFLLCTCSVIVYLDCDIFSCTALFQYMYCMFMFGLGDRGSTLYFNRRWAIMSLYFVLFYIYTLLTNT